MEKTILDVCCGSRMFWFDKNNEKVVFMDKRILHDILLNQTREVGCKQLTLF